MAISYPADAPLHDRSSFLAALLAAALCMVGSLASGEPAGDFTRECALYDVELLAELDQHRAAQDIAPDNLHAGYMAILRARAACARDPVAAIAMYDSVSFGPTLAAARPCAWGTLD